MRVEYVKFTGNNSVQTCSDGDLFVQVIDCYLHISRPGVLVVLGAEEFESVNKFPALSGYDTVEAHVIAQLETDKNGWVCFEHATKASSLEAYLLIAAGKRWRGHKTLAAPGIGEPAPLRKGHHTFCTVELIDEEPSPKGLLDQVKSTLGKLLLIRVLVEQGPNFGNQTCAFSLLRNLRRLGYEGPIEVYADAEVLPRNQTCECRFKIAMEPDANAAEVKSHAVQQMARVLALRYKVDLAVQSTGNDFYTCRVNFTTSPDEENMVYLAHAFEEMDVPFSMSMAHDDGSEEVTGDKEPGDKETKFLSLTLRLDIVTRSEISVWDKLSILEPGFHESNEFGKVQWLRTKVAKLDTTSDQRTLGMIPGGEFNPGNLKDYVGSYLKTFSAIGLQPYEWHPDDRGFFVKGEGAFPLCLPRASVYFSEWLTFNDPLEHIARVCDAGGLPTPAVKALLKLYELAAGEQIDLMTIYGIHQCKKSSMPVVVTNLLRGVMTAQEKASKPTVFLTIYKVDDLRKVVEDLELPYVTLRESLDTLTNLKSGAGCVIHSTALPQPVFQLFCQASTLPIILEGANTAALAQMLGKPYLSVATKDTPYIRLDDDCLGYDALVAAEKMLNDDSFSGVNGLAEFMTEARLGAKAFKGYFADLQKFVRQPSRDQVALALYRLGLTLSGAPPPAFQPAAEVTSRVDVSKLIK